jgi:uncharacterized membrane protein YkoI
MRRGNNAVATEHTKYGGIFSMRSKKRVIPIIALVVLLFGALAGGLLLTDSPVRAFAQDISETEDDDDDQPITGEALQQVSEAALQHARENGLGEGEVTDTELDDEEGYYEVEVTLEDGQEVDFHLNENFEVISQEDETDDEGEDESEDDDQPLTGEALEQATQAALEYARENGLGEGEVTDSEISDEEEGAYEVEVTLESGQEIELDLDDQFNVLGQEAEDDGADD